MAAITVNEQSSIRIQTDVVMYFDPLNLEGTPADADLVFVTHNHFDHFSPEDIAKIRREGTIFIIPETIRKDLTGAGIPEEKLICMKAGETCNVRGVRIEAVPAYNVNKKFHQKEFGWLGFLVTSEGVTYYIAGDTDHTPENEKVKCDVAFLPAGGTYTTTAEEAAALANAIRPKTVIPIHYGTIVGETSDGERFAKLVDPAIEVVFKLQF